MSFGEILWSRYYPLSLTTLFLLYCQNGGRYKHSSEEILMASIWSGPLLQGQKPLGQHLLCYQFPDVWSPDGDNFSGANRWGGSYIFLTLERTAERFYYLFDMFWWQWLPDPWITGAALISFSQFRTTKNASRQPYCQTERNIAVSPEKDSKVLIWKELLLSKFATYFCCHYNNLDNSLMFSLCSSW